MYSSMLNLLTVFLKVLYVHKMYMYMLSTFKLKQRVWFYENWGECVRVNAMKERQSKNYTPLPYIQVGLPLGCHEQQHQKLREERRKEYLDFLTKKVRYKPMHYIRIQGSPHSNNRYAIYSPDMLNFSPKSRPLGLRSIYHNLLTY